MTVTDVNKIRFFVFAYFHTVITSGLKGAARRYPVGISIGLGISIRIVSNFLVLSIRGIGSSSELKSPHLLFFSDFSLSIAYDIACLTFASLTFGLLTRKKIFVHSFCIVLPERAV